MGREKEVGKMYSNNLLIIIMVDMLIIINYFHY